MPLTHAVVDRATGLIVSRHGSLILARRAWRRNATVKKGGRIELTPWAARHMVVPLSSATANLARRRLAPAARVTAMTHPHVHRAFGMVAEDAGESARFEYVLPAEFEWRLGQAEVALGGLDEAGFETMPWDRQAPSGPWSGAIQDFGLRRISSPGSSPTGTHGPMPGLLHRPGRPTNQASPQSLVNQVRGEIEIWSCPAPD